MTGENADPAASPGEAALLTALIAARLHQAVGEDWHYRCGWDNIDDWGPEGFDPNSGDPLPCGKEITYRDYAHEVAGELVNDLDSLMTAFVAHRYAGSSSGGPDAMYELFCECGMQFSGDDFDDLRLRHIAHRRTWQAHALTTTIWEEVDDLDTATLARERFKAPVEDDTSLEDFAEELGIDLDAIRNRIAHRHTDDQVDTIRMLNVRQFTQFNLRLAFNESCGVVRTDIQRLVDMVAARSGKSDDGIYVDTIIEYQDPTMHLHHDPDHLGMCDTPGCNVEKDCTCEGDYFVDGHVVSYEVFGETLAARYPLPQDIDNPSAWDAYNQVRGAAQDVRWRIVDTCRFHKEPADTPTPNFFHAPSNTAVNWREHTRGNMHIRIAPGVSWSNVYTECAEAIVNDPNPTVSEGVRWDFSTHLPETVERC